jgi:hypothetical protein
MILACCQILAKEEHRQVAQSILNPQHSSVFLCFVFTSHAISNKSKQILWPAVELSEASRTGFCGRFGKKNQKIVIVSQT